MRTCTDCGRERPITEFRRRKKGSERRHHQCRQCFAQAMYIYRAARQRTAVGRFIAHMTDGRRALGGLTRIASEVVRKFGGRVASLSSSSRSSTAAWPTEDHAAASKVLLAIARPMLLAAPVVRVEAEAIVSTMTNEELEAFLAGVAEAQSNGPNDAL